MRPLRWFFIAWSLAGLYCPLVGSCHELTWFDSLTRREFPGFITGVLNMPLMLHSIIGGVLGSSTLGCFADCFIDARYFRCGFGLTGFGLVDLHD